MVGNPTDTLKQILSCSSFPVESFLCVLFAAPHGPDSDFIYTNLILLVSQRAVVPHAQRRSLSCLEDDSV